QEIRQILFPDCRDRVCPVSSSLGAGRQYDRTTSEHAFDLALQDAQLRRIDEIVGGIYRDQWCANLLEIRSGVVVPRCLDLVEKVVRVVGLQRQGHGGGES